MRDRGYSVAPHSKRYISGVARTIRCAVGPFVDERGYLQLDRLLESMPEALPGFEFAVLESREMGGDHARTLPDNLQMQIRQDVYDGLCRGNGRDRFTVAHELGHLFLHSGMSFARTWTPQQKVYYNSEWQADTFASALLIDEQLLAECRSEREVADRFGVTPSAAHARWGK